MWIRYIQIAPLREDYVKVLGKRAVVIQIVIHDVKTLRKAQELAVRVLHRYIDHAGQVGWTDDIARNVNP